MRDDKEIERIGEVFRKNGIGLKEIAKWWVHMYPEDLIWEENHIVAGITIRMKRLLEKMKEVQGDEQD